MGWGDEIMVSSIAKRLHAMTNMRVRVLGRHGEARWSEMWKYLPFMSEDGEKGPVANYICNGPGSRHYYSGMEDNHIQWRKWDIAPGEIRLTDEERAYAEYALFREMGPTNLPIVVIGPHWKAKGGGGENKNWGWEKWQEVATRLLREDIAWPVQCVPKGEPKLGTPYPVLTDTFREACAILERSIGYVGHEGGLHHAAAALGKRAVVVFGGYISSEVTGYPAHTNLYTPSPDYPLGCGSIAPCDHCRAAMDAISVEQVVEAVKEMVG